MNIEINDFEQIKKKGEETYKNFPDIYCPYLGQKISFNAQGI